MTRFFGFLMFLMFVEDSGCEYRGHLGAPFAWVNVLLEPTPLKLRPFDLIMIAILIVAKSKNKEKHALVAPMRNTLVLVLGTTVVWFVYGLFRGGEVRFASWQTYLILSTVLVAFTVAAVYRTPADFYGLGKWLILASLYRAGMCWLSYFTWGRASVGGSGAFLTTHDDTISWVVSIVALIVNSLDRNSLKITFRNLALIMFFAGAIQWNSRRIAWVSLVMALAVMYTLFPKAGLTKRRINRAVRIVAPIVILYVVVGWGRQSRIFLPLRSLSSISTHEDASTLARSAENLGLIATANANGLVMGSGWGRPYIPLTMKYDISGFELWRYIPHNSILGLLAFTGIIGFAGFWLAIPTAVFLNARIARMSPIQKARSVAIVGTAQMIVSANQLYGDMGIFFYRPMYVVAVSYAIAMRLPRVAGVWPGSGGKALSNSASTPQKARAEESAPYGGRRMSPPGPSYS